MSILLGNGKGGFVPAGSPVAVGTAPFGVVVGDFNGDGHADLAMANTDDNTVTILLGNGNGSFAQGSAGRSRHHPFIDAVGDFNGDGIPDLAVTNFTSNNVTILLGNGSGGFTQALGSPVTVGSGAYGVAVSDFNGDGIADLAVTNQGTVTSASCWATAVGASRRLRGRRSRWTLFPFLLPLETSMGTALRTWRWQM